MIATVYLERKSAERIKRTLDLVGACIGIAASLPVSAAIAFAILVDDGRPILFHHARVGKGGKEFELWKFRTMKNGTASQFGGFPPESSITRVGGFLRRTSLDELPQFLNVVRGEMSFVGPRPALKEQVGRYSSHQSRRLSVPPGITGKSQIKYRNNAKLSTRIDEDIRYIDDWSLAGDLRILLLTVPAVLLSRGVVAGQDASEVDDL